MCTLKRGRASVGVPVPRLQDFLKNYEMIGVRDLI